MGITMTTTGRSGKPERPSFLSRRAHLLTTTSSQASYLSPCRKRQVSLIPLLLLPPQSRLCGDPFVAVVSLPPVGLCALHEASAGCFSRGGRQCRSVSLPSLSVRLADGCRLICIFAANRCPYLGQPATRLRKSATAQGTPFGCGSFIAAMDDASPHRPFSFAAPKETKPPLAGGRKDVNDYGDLSSGSKGREPWRRPFRLRGVGLSELQRHLQ